MKTSLGLFVVFGISCIGDFCFVFLLSLVNWSFTKVKLICLFHLFIVSFIVAIVSGSLGTLSWLICWGRINWEINNVLVSFIFFLFHVQKIVRENASVTVWSQVRATSNYFELRLLWIKLTGSELNMCLVKSIRKHFSIFCMVSQLWIVIAKILVTLVWFNGSLLASGVVSVNSLIMNLFVNLIFSLFAKGFGKFIFWLSFSTSYDRVINTFIPTILNILYISYWIKHILDNHVLTYIWRPLTKFE